MDKLQCFIGQLGVAESSGGPVHAAATEVGAWRERDQHVPMMVEEIPHITAVMLAHRIARLEITAPRIPASGRELVAHPATVLAGYKNSGFHKESNLPHHDPRGQGGKYRAMKNLCTPIPDSGIPNSEIRMAYGNPGIPHHEITGPRGAHGLRGGGT